MLRDTSDVAYSESTDDVNCVRDCSFAAQNRRTDADWRFHDPHITRTPNTVSSAEDGWALYATINLSNRPYAIQVITADNVECMQKSWRLTSHGSQVMYLSNFLVVIMTNNYWCRLLFTSHWSEESNCQNNTERSFKYSIQNHIHRVQKNGTAILLPVTSPNANRFSISFRQLTQR